MADQMIHYNGDCCPNFNITISNIGNTSGGTMTDQDGFTLYPFDVENTIINQDADNDYLMTGDTYSINYQPLNTFTVDLTKYDISFIKETESIFIDFSVKTFMDIGGQTGNIKWQVGAGNNPISWQDITEEFTVDTACEDCEPYNRAAPIKFTNTKYMPFTIRLVGKVNNAGDHLNVKFGRFSSIQVNYIVYKA